MPKSKPKNDESEQQNDIENDIDQDLAEDSELDERKKVVREKKHDAGAADLERVTDYAEETEISTSDISGVMGIIGKEVAGRMAKESELLKVHIKKEDVQLIVQELEISEEKAERALREHGGNLMDTLVTLTN